MAQNRNTAISTALILVVTAFSCSLPMFRIGAPGAADKRVPKNTKLSGVLQPQESCQLGYYQIKLQGILENSQIQVETQTDSTGHFSLLAPAGTYLLNVTKDDCGSKESITLQENTEHMVAVLVRPFNSVDKMDTEWSRIPASILVPQKPSRAIRVAPAQP